MTLRHALSAVSVGLFGLLSINVLAGRNPGPIDAGRYLEHVKYLASEELRGRGTGSPELDVAADYLAEQLRLTGLRPVEGRQFFQRFPISTNAELGPSNRLAYAVDGEETQVRLSRHFVPLNFSGSGRVRAGLVFAGYGISAPEYGYDDYADIDAKGKIVVLLRHEPQEYDRNSVFAGKIYTEHSQLLSKATNARRHGARAMVMVNDTAQHSGGSDELTEFSTLPGPASAGIPFLHIDTSIAEQWFSLAERDFRSVQEEINDTVHPASFTFPDSLEVVLRADVRYSTRRVRNVAAYLPGRTNEYVIVGAHYDHIGLGEQFSMRPSAAGTPHLGADDNASGTAGLLELARWFAARPPPKRGILFLAFAAEELGLLGSSYYVGHPLLPVTDAVAMINMDMIGRIRDDRVYVGGSTTGSNFRSILEAHAARFSLDLDFSDTIGYGSSDHTAFTTKQIPVLFFFSGLHGDYHRPSDTWEKIRPAEAATLLEYIAAVVGDLAGDIERPVFIGVPELAKPGYDAISSPD